MDPGGNVRRIGSIVAVVALLLTVLPAPAGLAENPAVFSFEGSGWGHGVGLSQYGARAMAESGWTAEQIVGYYYTGTSTNGVAQVLAPDSFVMTDPDPLWIGLHQNQAVLRFQMQNGQAGLCKAGDGEGDCLPPLNGTQFAGPGENWELRALGGGVCQFFKEGTAVGNPGNCRTSITWLDQPNTRVFFPDTGRTYARGTLRTRPNSSGGFHVVLEIGLEDYAYGIGEVPSSWSMEALKAQAIAARTYGVRQTLRWGPEAGFTSSRQEQCWCQLFSTVVDQNYVGWSKESGLDGDRWVQAVNETAGRVVTHPAAPEQTIITAYYSSSSGGATESNVSGLGHTSLIPYLAGVPDPWSVDPLAQNPYASWTKEVAAADLAGLYGLDSVTSVEVTARNESGSAAEVVISGTLNGVGQQLVRSGRSVKSTLGLRSSYFDVVGGGSTPAVLNIPFKDLDGNEHAQSVQTIWDTGITKGCSPDAYCPSQPVTRWQMALFLTRLWPHAGFDLPDGGSQGFTDILSRSADEQRAINQLKQLGFTTGTSDTTFDPEGTVTRWQMALFLTRIVAATGIDLPDGFDQGFADLGSIQPNAQVAINQLKQLGITTGTSATTFNPTGLVRRDQMASFLARTLQLVGAGL